MVYARFIARGSVLLASLVLVVGCASDQREPSSARVETADATAAAPSFDPLNGEYPQIMWMCNVYEVPAGTEIASDGTVHASTSAKPNGVGVAAASDTKRMLESIRTLPAAKHLGTPVCFSPPTSPARIEPGSRDKSGGSIGGRSLMLTGDLFGERVRTTAEITTTSGAFSTTCRCGARDVTAGGALLLLCAGADSSQPWTLLVARPTVLRSAADFPYQTASFSSSGAAR